MEKSHFINMGLSELLMELYTNKLVRFGYLDIYNHIKSNTNNFNKINMLLMYDEIERFVGEHIIFEYKGEGYTLSELFWIRLVEMGKNNNEKGEKLQSEVEFGGKWDDAINKLIINPKITELFVYQHMIWAFENNSDWELRTPHEYHLGLLMNYAETFNNELIVHKLVIDEIRKEYPLYKKPTNTKKQQLTFPGLFKDEYKGNIQLFYSRLIANGLIDKNHVWRETTEKNEPAKVYFWLLHKGVFNINKPTPALICFCKEFGITVYRDTEPTPPADVRAVTVKNLLNAETTITPDDRKRFGKIFEPFLIK